jgi:hypothetical protein
MTRHLQVLSVIGLAGVIACGGACSNSSSSSGSGGAGIQSLLFIKRQTMTKNADGSYSVDVAGGNGQVLDYQRYVPGGSLNLLTPARSDGTLTSLTSDFPNADFNGADVSFDANQAVFSMKADANDHYHLYTVELTPDSNGKFVVHQKTNGNYDDINPIYVPGGLIAFVTNEMYTAMGTRADEYEHAREALQLATITVDGGDATRHNFGQNISHMVAPFLRSDGRIGFSQWEHFASVNDVKVRVANPDGTQVLAVSGQHGKPGDALFTVKETTPNQMVAILTARDRTIHAGALITIDARNHNDPVCLTDANYFNGAAVGHACLDEEHATYNVLTPNVPYGSDPSPVGRYREPNVLPDGRIITSWADGPVSDLNEQSLTPPDFGIYIYDTATGQNQLVYNDRTTWDLNAVPVVPHNQNTPVISAANHTVDSTVPAIMGSIDITQTSLNETVSGAQMNNLALGTALQQAVAVRVIEGFSSEAAKGVSMFGLTMFEGAAVLGEAKVFNDNSWLAAVPPYVPIHLQPIDQFGLAIRNQQLWLQTLPGEERRCEGCHESRTGQGIPALGQNPTAAEQATGGKGEQFIEPIADRTEFPWQKVQAVIDTNGCSGCHNSTTTNYYYMTRTDPVSGQTTTYKVPSLDLSSTPVTVYYDRMVASYPASYVSIFYPATLSMGDSTGKITYTGAAPCSGQGLNGGASGQAVLKVDGTIGSGCTPWWGIPGSARASALTEVLNLHGADGTSTAWPTGTHPFHPENVNTTMSDADRKTLAVYPMDLGGQYWARQNTGFVPYINGDPVNPNHVAQ